MLILWKLEQVGEHMIASERTYTELRGQQKPRWVHSTVDMCRALLLLAAESRRASGQALTAVPSVAPAHALTFLMAEEAQHTSHSTLLGNILRMAACPSTGNICR